jgi:ribosomal protein L21
MYAIVKAGGHQEKVEVGDVILVNRLDAKKGDTVEFPVSLVVDGDKVTLAAADLAKVDRISLMGGSTEEIEALRHRYPRLGLTTWTKENRVQL